MVIATMAMNHSARRCCCLGPDQPVKSDNALPRTTAPLTDPAGIYLLSGISGRCGILGRCWTATRIRSNPLAFGGASR